MKITKRSLNMCSVVGAGLLLVSWLFQHLYAESINAEQARLKWIETCASSYDALVPVFKALVLLAYDNEKIQKEIDSLAIESMYGEMKLFAKLDFTGILDDVESDVESDGIWFWFPSTIEELKRDLKNSVSILRPELQKMRDPEYLNKLADLPEDEFQKKLNELRLQVSSCIYKAVLIKKDLLDTKTRRIRWIFIALYISGSMMAIGAQTMKVVFFTED